MKRINEFVVKYKYYFIITFLVGIAFLGTSFALFRQDIVGVNTYSMDIIDLSATIESGDLVNNSINISDGEVKKFTISLINNNSIDAKFNLYYTNPIDKLEVMYEGERPPGEDGEVFEAGYTKSYTIVVFNNTGSDASITFGADAGFDYNVLDFLSGARAITEEYSSEATADPNDKSGANPPELIGDMIPVVYDEFSNNWVKAGSGNWYNYDEQKWANAVTVNSTNRSNLVNSAPGTIIPMSDINTFMVWIPRYSYTLGNTYGYQGYGGSTPSVDTPGAFNIKFVSTDTKELGSAVYSGNTPANWFTPSAFCWGDYCDRDRNNSLNKELSGMWVAKFEASESSDSKVNVLPNVTSWRLIDTYNIHLNIADNMNGSNGLNIYGLSGSTANAHLMKNTEWGSVSYLSQSKYGKYGNTNYTGENKEIAINNCSTFITGISGDAINSSSSSASCSVNTYNTQSGQKASTTGNVYGIYDMSGGSYEIIMGNMTSSGNDYTEFNTTVYDGFPFDYTLHPAPRFFNSYSYGDSMNDFSRGLLGDGTKEVANFYSDNASFVYHDDMFGISGFWFSRGGSYSGGDFSGIFNFSYMHMQNYGAGAAPELEFFSFRPVIIP